jgi:hypothetical protein
MNLKPHPLRPLSNILHRIAVSSCIPLFIARPLAHLSSRLYYTL